jgi:hypothetical protein
MNGCFLSAFADLIGKQHGDEYRREDVLRFRNHLLPQSYESQYIDTQMSFVIQILGSS